MLDPGDLITYELCFPGAVTNSTEIKCPHCGELLTVPVDEPMEGDLNLDGLTSLSDAAAERADGGRIAWPVLPPARA